jgi:2-amino-4-hydroxy-6-hydroxymethyldihydropteridine diphosphokinase
VTDYLYIGLGSNLGSRSQHLESAVRALEQIDEGAVVRRSCLYESAPLGPTQPRFLNAAVQMECALAPQQLLSILKQIELDQGRQRTDRWGPRSLDLDILLWDNRVVADANLQIPHLELHKRRFALEPLCDLAPTTKHPLLGKTISELLRSVLAQDVVRLASRDWPAALRLGASG